MVNCEWGIVNCEWGMGNGEWGMGNGEWGMGNGERPLASIVAAVALDDSISLGNEGGKPGRHQN
ncbi:MAG: hypothetical protein CSB13_04155 [Chloroflexi bacterium]|nr:MAG: hypothetical protein CSB13_04155 [Chloroflexota bacterium]